MIKVIKTSLFPVNLGRGNFFIRVVPRFIRGIHVALDGSRGQVAGRRIKKAPILWNKQNGQQKRLL